MDAVIAGSDRVVLTVSEDELLTLRHSVIEALEALSAEDFKIRTGGEASDARKLKDQLVAVSREVHRSQSQGDNR